MKKKALIYKAVCAVVAISIILSCGAFCVFAENATEESADVVFFDSGTLAEIIQWGHNTESSTVTDDKTGISALRLTPVGEKEDPYTTFYLTETIQTEEYPFVAILVKKQAQMSDVQLFFRTEEHDNFTEKASKKGKYNPNNKWQIVVFEMSDLPEWSSALTVLRLDYISAVTSSSEYCDLAGILLGKSENAVLDAASGFFAEKLGAVQRFSNFKDIDVGYFSSAYQTSVGVTRGNLLYEAVGSPSGQVFDPQAMWNIENFCIYKGVTPICADEFTHLVIKHKSSIEYDPQQLLEIFYQAGDRYHAQGGYSGHNNYKPEGEWQATVIDFSKGPAWSGVVHSLRIDWANSFAPNARGSMEVSDFVFFADSKSAVRYADIINNIVVYAVEHKGGNEEETWVDIEDGTLDVGTFEEDSTEAQETTEETLPEFIETTEETTRDITEDVTEEVTEEESEEKTEETAESKAETEEESEDKPTTPITPDIPVPPGDDTATEGSQAPFVIACVILAMLSIASIITVIVIRKKNK